MLHIQIFPLTVADTFVTLSWNTSRSLARDFVLQVRVAHTIMGFKQCVLRARFSSTIDR